MKKIIAYFDYLGFKDFIERNDSSFQHRIMGNNFRDIEMALSNGQTMEVSNKLVPNIESSNVNCMNFSDTVVFWSNDDSEESLNSILKVAYRFNWHSNLFTFPVKGALVHGEIFHVDFRKDNIGGGKYNVNSLYGKGLVEAHQLSEDQDWAGAVVDESIVDLINSRGSDPLQILDHYAKRYMVPYKSSNADRREQFAFRLVEGSLAEEAFENRRKDVSRNFGEYNKRTDHPSVQKKLENTIIYLKSFI